MNLALSDITVLCLIFALLVVVRNYASPRPRAPFPPGPPAGPLLGHLRIMPTSKISETFHEWCRKYGDIIHLRVLGSTFIILGSDEVARELLDKRGSKYSSRPSFTIYHLLGWFPHLTFLPYGKRFIKHRKVVQGSVSKDEIQKYRPLHAREVNRALKSFLNHPNSEYHQHILKKYSLGTMVHLTYGHALNDDDDDVFLRFSNNVTGILAQPGATGFTIVDLLPFLQHLPSWFPGTYYANWAREVKYVVEELNNWPYERFLEQIKEQKRSTSASTTKVGAVGNWDLDSVMGRLVRDSMQEDQISDDPEHAQDIKGIGATMLVAGTDTTYISSCWFLLLMVANPVVQKKGQEEVDAVTGGDRLPTLEDRESLPYIEAIMQEVLRWHPVLPLSIPHRTTEDDIFRDMFIPKGSIVVANTRGISLDERIYGDPHIFRPERFLPISQGGSGEPSFTAAFGYGRRICPGQWIAGNALWLLIASMLSVFDVVKDRDANGKEVELTMDFVEGMAHSPAPFACVVKPRSPNAISLVREIV